MSGSVSISWSQDRNTVLWFLAFVGVFAFYVIRSFSHLISHDVGWFLYGAGRLLDGARLYRDVIDLNPPLVFYLGMPAVWLGRIGGWSEIDVYRILILLTILLSLLLSSRLLNSVLSDLSLGLRRALFLFLALLLTTLAASDFGQREHVMAILIFPYLCGVAVHAKRKDVRPGFGALVGLLAGIGFALKPYFPIPFIVLEIYLVRKLRGVSSLLRPDVLVVVGVQVLYWTVVLLCHKEYIDIVVQMGQFYEAYDTTLEDTLANRVTPFLLLSVPVFFAQRSNGRVKEFRSVTFVAGSAFFVVGVLQHKGWAYHFYPALTALGLFLVASGAVAMMSWRKSRYFHWLTSTRFINVIIPLTLITLMITFDIVWSARKKAHADLIPFLAQRAAGRSVFVFSTGMTPAFPAVNYSRAVWQSPFACLWFLPALYHDEGGQSNTPDGYNSLAQMGSLERRFFNQVVSDLVTTPPSLLVSNTSEWKQALGRRSFDFIQYY
ncbi:MAG: hypothetical protein AAB393_07155, partial [Bacteroidota bacterium]